MTQAEEAEIFAYQNRNVASLKPIDKYTSLLVAGDTITTNIERITEQYGFVVTNKKKNVPRAISSFGALYTIMTDNTTIGYDGCACLENPKTHITERVYLELKYDASGKPYLVRANKNYAHNSHSNKRI